MAKYKMMKNDVEILLSELFDGKYSPKLTNEKWEAVKAQPNIIIFYHIDKNRAVAMTTLYVMNLFSRKVGIIEEVVTLKEYRNKGIGSGLVRSAIEEAKKEGCDCVELNVREDRPSVQKFYEDLGFKDRKQKAMRLWI